MRKLAVETARTSVKRLRKSLEQVQDLAGLAGLAGEHEEVDVLGSKYELKKQETCQLQVSCASKIEKALESETLILSFSMDEDKLDRKLDQKTDSSIKAFEMSAPKLDGASCVSQVNKMRIQYLSACVRATDEKDVKVKYMDTRMEYSEKSDTSVILLHESSPPLNDPQSNSSEYRESFRAGDSVKFLDEWQKGKQLGSKLETAQFRKELEVERESMPCVSGRDLASGMIPPWKGASFSSPLSVDSCKNSVKLVGKRDGFKLACKQRGPSFSGGLKKYQVLDGVPELRNGEIQLWKSSDGNKSGGSCESPVIEGTLKKCCSGPDGVAAVAWNRVRLWRGCKINSPFIALRKQRKLGSPYRCGELDLFQKFGPYLHDLPLLGVGDRVLSGFCHRGIYTWPYVFGLGSDDSACWHFLWWIYGKVFDALFTSREGSLWECPWSHFLWWIYGKVFDALFTSRERSWWECPWSHFLWWIYGKVFKALCISSERSRWECPWWTTATLV